MISAFGLSVSVTHLYVEAMISNEQLDRKDFQQGNSFRLLEVEGNALL